VREFSAGKRIKPGGQLIGEGRVEAVPTAYLDPTDECIGTMEGL
jgi:hypothetical protein